MERDYSIRGLGALMVNQIDKAMCSGSCSCTWSASQIDGSVYLLDVGPTVVGTDGLPLFDLPQVVRPGFHSGSLRVGSRHPCPYP
jgi:hypothetical protein